MSYTINKIKYHYIILYNMSVNIFGGGKNTATSASHASVSVAGTDINFNQRLIVLSKKLAQKVNKSGDTMDGGPQTEIQTRLVMCFFIFWC